MDNNEYMFISNRLDRVLKQLYLAVNSCQELKSLFYRIEDGIDDLKKAGERFSSKAFDLANIKRKINSLITNARKNDYLFSSLSVISLNDPYKSKKLSDLQKNMTEHAKSFIEECEKFSSSLYNGDTDSKSLSNYERSLDQMKYTWKKISEEIESARSFIRNGLDYEVRNGQVKINEENFGVKEKIDAVKKTQVPQGDHIKKEPILVAENGLKVPLISLDDIRNFSYRHHHMDTGNYAIDPKRTEFTDDEYAYQEFLNIVQQKMRNKVYSNAEEFNTFYNLSVEGKEKYLEEKANEVLAEMTAKIDLDRAKSGYKTDFGTLIDFAALHFILRVNGYDTIRDGSVSDVAHGRGKYFTGIKEAEAINEMSFSQEYRKNYRSKGMNDFNELYDFRVVKAVSDYDNAVLEEVKKANSDLGLEKFLEDLKAENIDKSIVIEKLLKKIASFPDINLSGLDIEKLIERDVLDIDEYRYDYERYARVVREVNNFKKELTKIRRFIYKNHDSYDQKTKRFEFNEEQITELTEKLSEIIGMNKLELLNEYLERNKRIRKEKESDEKKLFYKRELDFEREKHKPKKKELSPLQRLKNGEKGIMFSPELYSDEKFMSEVILFEPEQIKFSELRNDYSFMLKAIQKNLNLIDLIGDNLRSNEEFLAKIIKFDAKRTLNNIANQQVIYDSKRIMSDLILQNPTMIENASAKLMEDDEFVLYAFANCWGERDKILKKSHKLVSDPNFMSKIWKISSKDAIKNTPRELYEDDKFFFDVVKINPKAYDFMPKKHSKNKDLLEKAILANAKNIDKADDSIVDKKSKEILLEYYDQEYSSERFKEVLKKVDLTDPLIYMSLSLNESHRVSQEVYEAWKKTGVDLTSPTMVEKMNDEIRKKSDQVYDVIIKELESQTEVKKSQKTIAQKQTVSRVSKEEIEKVIGNSGKNEKDHEVVEDVDKSKTKPNVEKAVKRKEKSEKIEKTKMAMDFSEAFPTLRSGVEWILSTYVKDYPFDGNDLNAYKADIAEMLNYGLTQTELKNFEETPYLDVEKTIDNYLRAKKIDKSNDEEKGEK